MKWCPHFASQVNFLDQQTTNDGKPYAPIRYKELVRNCFLVSMEINTSYNDLLQITPRELNYMLEFIKEKRQKEIEAIEKARAEREINKGNRK